MIEILKIAVVLLGACPLLAAGPVVEVDSRIYKAGADGVTPLASSIASRLSYVYRATEDNYKFCHHPALIQFRNRLFCVWSHGKVGEDEPGQRLAISTSKNGRQWTGVRGVFAENQIPGAENHVFVAAGFLVWQEKLTLFFTMTPGKNFHPDTALYHTQSDDGHHWSNPTRITDGFFINPPLLLRGGRLLMGGEYVSEEDRETKRAKLIYHEGQSLSSGWSIAKLTEGDITRIGYAEPNFMERKHDVVGFFRNYTGQLLVSRSMDSGQSWEPFTDSGIPDSTARFAVGSLPGGQKYLVGNTLHKKFDRRALVLSVSDDRGESMTRCFIVRNEPTTKRFEGQHKLDGWQYPHGYVWKNKLLIVHSVNKEDVAVSALRLQDLKAPNGKYGKTVYTGIKE